MYRFQVPLGTSCVTLGKSPTISGLGRPRGRLQGSSGQWGQAIRVEASGLPTSGPGQLVAGAGRVAKETSHHPSRRPGSVLNVCSTKPKLSTGGGQKGRGQWLQLQRAHPHPEPRCRREGKQSSLGVALGMAQTEGHRGTGAPIAEFWCCGPAPVPPCQTQPSPLWLIPLALGASLDPSSPSKTWAR